MVNSRWLSDGRDRPAATQSRVLPHLAERLRSIAKGLRYDLRRADQLRALADGFERFATRIEQEADLDAAK
jgi:hypothetical protein